VQARVAPWVASLVKFKQALHRLIVQIPGIHSILALLPPDQSIVFGVEAQFGVVVLNRFNSHYHHGKGCKDDWPVVASSLDCDQF